MFTIKVIDPKNVTLLMAAQELRASVYENDKLEDPKKFVEGRYVDDNDAWSHHIVATNIDGDVVGTIKVVPRKRGKRLKLESDVPSRLIKVPRGVKAVELARLAVMPEYRKLGVSLGLWQMAYRLMLKFDYELVFAFQREKVLASEESMGMPVQRLSAPIKGQFGLNLTPTLIRVSEVIESLYRVNPAMAIFFDQPMQGGIFQPTEALRASKSELAEYARRFARPSSLELVS